MRVLDSHLHLWNLGVLTYGWHDGALAATYAEDQIGDERLAGVDQEAAVFVQAAPDAGHDIDEVRWVESVASEAGVVAIVAGARLDLGELTEAHLKQLAAHERVVGVRHLLQSEPDGLARSPEFIAGARAVASCGWTFDACVVARQIPDVTALAAAVPELPIVLDHLGKPAIGTADAAREPSAEWLGDLRELASSPQVFCKLSGLPAEAGGNWSDDQVVPFLDAALDSFGTERLMWGSDWPVSSVDFTPPEGSEYRTGDRRRWFGTVVEWAASRGVDVDAILWANAHRFYGIR